MIADVHHPPASWTAPIQDVESPRGEIGVRGPSVRHPGGRRDHEPTIASRDRSSRYVKNPRASSPLPDRCIKRRAVPKNPFSEEELLVIEESLPSFPRHLEAMTARACLALVLLNHASRFRAEHYRKRLLESLDKAHTLLEATMREITDDDEKADGEDKPEH